LIHSAWKGVGSYSTVGLELALSILVGLFGGRWLDARYQAGGWLTVLGLGFGIAAGVRAVLRALRLANEQAQELEREDREARARFHGEADSRELPDDDRNH